ncbi:hypothetical protein [Gynuella sunshinyii]|uniref:Probable chemoreceptor glutamine deamidase CheD n=1 Tax=Gynuella sunshinyii YC6258 TaxID=1445510 RepID=A0A0C5VCP9_9GAMM|nr:hypothetical protein [Gynuella sunshinyii]AJQ97115.1 chemotaxis protein [Gynuella sunshinyii YC6258]
MDPNVLNIFLKPGEFYFGDGRTCIHTLLGSCVAITLWHPQLLIGGMCHYMLPTRGRNRHLSAGHFADEAIQLFLQAIEKWKTDSNDYEVKLFGGGSMIPDNQRGSSESGIPWANINIGKTLLQQYGFKIKACDVGGNGHRKLFLELWSGDVWVQTNRLTQPG